MSAPSIPKPDKIACPQGAVLKGTPPPEGTYAWCELPDGRRHGPWMTWPTRGNPRKIAIYRKGKLNGTWTQWHYEGDSLESIDHYVDDLRHGASSRWHSNGRLAQNGEFRDGYPIGRFRAWERKGKLISDVRMTRAGGVLVTWDGELRVEETWRNGKRHGLTRAWYPSGQKERETMFKDGLPHGAFVEWYDNGQKRQEGTAEKGVGRSETSWTRDGEIEPEMCAHGPCNAPPKRKWTP